MAILNQDKGTYKIRYCIHSIDNTCLFKIKIFKSGGRARLALREIERLEELSEKRKLTVRKLAYFVYRKLITPEDARSLTKEKVFSFSPYELTIESDQCEIGEINGAWRTI